MLVFFSVEIILNIVAFKSLFFTEKLNILDIIAIILTFLLCIIDMAVTDQVASGFLRMRGIFRIFKLVVLARKLDHIQEKKVH